MLWCFYVDESYDVDKFCLTAIGIRHADWRAAFEMVKSHRKELKQKYGLLLSKEIHASEFISGRGQISNRPIHKHIRAGIFRGILCLVSRLPNVMLINVCLDCGGRSDPQMDAWDRLINRIDRTMKAQEDAELLERGRMINSEVNLYMVFEEILHAAKFPDLSESIDEWRDW